VPESDLKLPKDLSGKDNPVSQELGAALVYYIFVGAGASLAVALQHEAYLSASRAAAVHVESGWVESR